MQSSSSTSPPKKPTAPSKKQQQQQQLISTMFASNTITPQNPIKSTKKPKPATKPTTEAATAKFLRDPQSLKIAELKTLLRADGKSVSGNKARLLHRLTGNDDDDTFSINGQGTCLPPRDLSPSASHALRLIPFDGQGCDPATLVGHRIQRYEINGLCGFILHTDHGPVTITFSDGMHYSRYADIFADAALLEGLKSVKHVTDILHLDDEDITRAARETQAKKGGGNLLIVEAAVGMRKCPDFGEYRVVGIRCEGMEEMGFVFAEDEELEDHYGRDPRFGGVAVATESEGGMLG